MKNILIGIVIIIMVFVEANIIGKMVEIPLTELATFIITFILLIQILIGVHYISNYKNK